MRRLRRFWPLMLQGGPARHAAARQCQHQSFLQPWGYCVDCASAGRWTQTVLIGSAAPGCERQRQYPVGARPAAPDPAVSGAKCVATLDLSGIDAAFEPGNPLLAGTVRERLGHDRATSAALQSIVPDL